MIIPAIGENKIHVPVTINQNKLRKYVILTNKHVPSGELT